MLCCCLLILVLVMMVTFTVACELLNLLCVMSGGICLVLDLVGLLIVGKLCCLIRLVRLNVGIVDLLC